LQAGGDFGTVDTLAGTLPDFTVDGGNDLLILGSGNDGSTCDHFRVAAGRISGDGGNDTINGGPGLDSIWGDHQGGSVSVVSGDDDLFGDAGNDGLHGDSFAPATTGPPATLPIDSGNGQDSCDGGLDTDTAANCEVLAGVP
jgi:Ca2+-binding RTX toxin-like protein